MGLQTVPAYIGQTGYNHPVELDRNLIEALGGKRTGAMRLGDFATALVGSNSFQMSIAAGSAIIVGQEAGQTLQGAYFAWSNASENKLFAGPSGSPRIDSLILRVIDTQYGSDPGSPRAEWEIVQGTPAGSPVAKPDSDFAAGGTHYKPGAWWRLKDIRINPGDTDLVGGQITDQMTWARLGNRTICRSKTVFPTDNQVGDMAYSIAGSLWWEYGVVGAWSGWVPPKGSLVASLEQSSAQSLGNNAVEGVTWNVENFDLLGAHSTSSNTSRFTPDVPGWYTFVGGASFSNNATGFRSTGWAKNSTSENATAVTLEAINGQSTVMTTRTHTMYMNGTSDFAEMTAQQTSGGSLNTNATTTQRSAMRVYYSGLTQ